MQQLFDPEASTTGADHLLYLRCTPWQLLQQTAHRLCTHSTVVPVHAWHPCTGIAHVGTPKSSTWSCTTVLHHVDCLPADLIRFVKDPNVKQIQLVGDIDFSPDLFPPENNVLASNDLSKGVNASYEVRMQFCCGHLGALIAGDAPPWPVALPQRAEGRLMAMAAAVAVVAVAARAIAPTQCRALVMTDRWQASRLCCNNTSTSCGRLLATGTAIWQVLLQAAGAQHWHCLYYRAMPVGREHPQTVLACLLCRLKSGLAPVGTTPSS